MIVLFIVVANQVLQCFGARFCDYFNSVDFIRMWEIGAVETMFEGLGIKIYRRVRDKITKEENYKDIQL